MNKSASNRSKKLSSVKKASPNVIAKNLPPLNREVVYRRMAAWLKEEEQAIPYTFILTLIGEDRESLKCFKPHYESFINNLIIASQSKDLSHIHIARYISGCLEYISGRILSIDLDFPEKFVSLVSDLSQEYKTGGRKVMNEYFTGAAALICKQELNPRGVTHTSLYNLLCKSIPLGNNTLEKALLVQEEVIIEEQKAKTEESLVVKKESPNKYSNEKEESSDELEVDEYERGYALFSNEGAAQEFRLTAGVIDSDTQKTESPITARKNKPDDEFIHHDTTSNLESDNYMASLYNLRCRCQILDEVRDWLPAGKPQTGTQIDMMNHEKLYYYLDTAWNE